MLVSTTRFSAMLVALLATLAAAEPQVSTWSMVPLAQNDEKIVGLTNELVDKLKQRVGPRLGMFQDRTQQLSSLLQDAHFKDCYGQDCLGKLAREVRVDRVLWIDTLVAGEQNGITVMIVNAEGISLAEQTVLIPAGDPAEKEKLNQLVERVVEELLPKLPPELPTSATRNEPKTNEVLPRGPDPRTDRKSGDGNHTIAWVVTGASAVALVSGGVFGVKTLNSRSPDDAFKANVLYGIGGGLALTSVALFYFNFKF